MRICVFLGSSSGNRKRYAKVAQDLGRFLASNGIGLVYGGASIGLMGELARSASVNGGEVIGVIPHTIAHIEIPPDDITELIYVDSLEERENLMFARSDGFVAMPGGIGTLEEIFTALTWNALEFHCKPVGLLNSFGYYDAFLEFLKFQSREGFVSQRCIDSLIVEEDIENLVHRVILACKGPDSRSTVEQA